MYMYVCVSIHNILYYVFCINFGGIMQPLVSLSCVESPRHRPAQSLPRPCRVQHATEAAVLLSGTGSIG